MSHFGIDFGTTNSGAFEIDGVSKQHFGDEEGKPLPSIVVIDRATGKPLGGRDVWNHRLSYREKGGFCVVPPLKTLLDDADWREGRWTVPELVATVLTQLSRRAVTMGVRHGINQATFSIPVGLKPQARRTLREAARIAGITVTGFVNESTAALIRYWTRVRDYRFVAVFDWGGETFFGTRQEFPVSAPLNLPTLGTGLGMRIEAQSVSIIHAYACLGVLGVGLTISSTPFRRVVWVHIIHAEGVVLGT